MLELADEADSKSVGLITRAGSTPATGTTPNGSQTLDMTGFAGFFYCVVSLMYRSLSQRKPAISGQFSAVFRRDIGGMFNHYSEGYTPMIALADATFEVKCKCV